MWFNLKKDTDPEEKREEQEEEQQMDETAIDDPILRALLGEDEITRETVMNIPAVSACIDRISDTVASLPVKLYKKEGDKVEEVTDDRRTRLLNDDTGDTLDGYQLKKAMVEDMYLDKGGYAYVHWAGNDIRSVHYVEPQRVSINYGTDPIFKDYQILVNGKRYEGWQFIKLIRKTRTGWSGKSILEDCKSALSVVYAAQLFEKNLVKTGGNKKGFIQSTSRLTKAAMNALKDAFRKLYANNSENVVILNDGLKFQESSNTSVELQLNENKKTNNDDICKIFLVPPSVINGGATEEDKKTYMEGCILPVLERFNTAINSVMLLESEKETMFFAFDDTDLLKGDIEKRFKAYETAVDKGFMQIDEVRRKEKLPALNLGFIKMGLQDVIYYPETKEIYTPNTNKISKLGAPDAEPGPKPVQGEGETDED